MYPKKHLGHISKEELDVAMEKFFMDLDIPGSIASQYDLYEAIYRQHGYAVDVVNTLHKKNVDSLTERYGGQ